MKGIQTLHLLSGAHLRESRSFVFLSSQHFLLPTFQEGLKPPCSHSRNQAGPLLAYHFSLLAICCPILPVAPQCGLHREQLYHLISHVGVGSSALQELHHLQVASTAGPVHSCAVQLQGMGGN